MRTPHSFHNASPKINFRRRVPGLGYYWSRSTPAGGISTSIQLRDWRLVLDAHSIPNRVAKIFGETHLYVPAFLERLAKSEIAAYRSENRPKRILNYWSLHKNAWLALFFLLPLAVWGFWRGGVLNAPDFLPPPETWLKIGALDSTDFKFKGQWSRALTALTLHADARHLAGNLFFGGIFLYFLARLTGPGWAVFLTVTAGAIGNCLSVFAHRGAYASIGFSTALFAAAGLLGGIMAWRDRRRMLLPIAAAAGLLAMLGAEGQNTDYAAHICGLTAGLGAGCIVGWLHGLDWPAPPQWLGAFLGFALLACAWLRAFSFY